MYNIIRFILSVVLITMTQGWGACITNVGSITPYYASCGCLGSGSARYFDCDYSTSSFGGSVACTGTQTYNACGSEASNRFGLQITGTGQNRYIVSCSGPVHNGSSISYTRTICDTQQEADSLECVNGNEWDSDADTCKVCRLSDSTWRESSCGYSVRHSMYLNVITTCRRTNCNVDCISNEYYAQTCDTTGADSSITCMGSVDGVNVYLRGASGRVTSCDADGSCSFALQKVALGQCPNPNDPPTQRSSSSAEGEQSSSSAEGEQSSSSGGGGSEPGSSDAQNWTLP